MAVVATALTQASAGTLRVWPTTVVVHDTVYLSDLCEINGFAPDVEQMLRDLVIGQAPSPGAAEVVPISRIRAAVSDAGVNMALLILHGSGRCEVNRPSITLPPQPAAPARDKTMTSASITSTSTRGSRRPASSPTTLRDAVIDFFNKEFARYRGRADVVFDHTVESMLGLSGPAYAFNVRLRGRKSLGLVQLEVDVLADGRVVQTVPLVVRVAMMRREVVARRAINTGATIGAGDVDLVSLSFTRLDRLGLTDPTQVIGQRSKRFIAAGLPIDPDAFEQVPLVTRGQLVSVTAISGAVRVVSAGTATREGLLGDTVRIRASDNKRIELDAVVVGPGAVQIGGRLPSRLSLRALAESRTR